MRKIIGIFCLVIIIALLFGLFGRAREETREEAAVYIPVGMEVTRLSEILENPANYDGKRVLLEGVVGPGCLTCPGDFPYQEGVNSIQLFVRGFRRPRLRRGQPIRVYAEVKAGEARVVISALAMEVR
jgi:hypothetical protein